MATVYQYFIPEMGRIRSATAFPAFRILDGSAAPVSGLFFDATTSETIHFQWKARNYGSGNITVTIEWYADTATTNAVVWSCAIAAYTLNTDTGAFTAKAYSTATNVTDTNLGATAQRGHSIDCVVTNLDSIANGDTCWLRVSRLPADGSDTMTGDAVITGIEISYSDT